VQQIKSLSVIIPVFNEENGINEALQDIIAELDCLSMPAEIIVINDGSVDGSGKVLSGWTSKEPRVKILHHERNLGKGSAVRTGLSAASLEWVLLIDADLQIPTSALSRFDTIASGYDVLIGHRIDKKYSFHRRLLSYVYRLTAQIMFGLNLSDVGCPFKLFRREALQPLKLSATGFGIDVELMWRLARNGVRIDEIPVVSLPRKFGVSKVTLAGTAGCVRELLLLRLKG